MGREIRRGPSQRSGEPEASPVFTLWEPASLPDCLTPAPLPSPTPAPAAVPVQFLCLLAKHREASLPQPGPDVQSHHPSAEGALAAPPPALVEYANGQSLALTTICTACFLHWGLEHGRMANHLRRRMRMGTLSEEPGSPGDLPGSHLRPPAGPELGVSATLSPSPS